MKGFSDSKKSVQQLFQVLLLDNDENLDVHVHEAALVDYSTVKAHLRNGGSVFITSKKQQKLFPPKTGKAQQNYTATRRKYGVIIQDTYKKQNIV